MPNVKILCRRLKHDPLLKSYIDCSCPQLPNTQTLNPLHLGNDLCLFHNWIFSKLFEGLFCFAKKFFISPQLPNDFILAAICPCFCQRQLQLGILQYLQFS